jgi:hypothetical protein
LPLFLWSLLGKERRGDSEEGDERETTERGE